MILKISFRAIAGVPKTLLKRKLGLHSLYFPQNTLMLTEFCGEFSDLHSIFRLRALRYCLPRPPPTPFSFSKIDFYIATTLTKTQSN